MPSPASWPVGVREDRLDTVALRRRAFSPCSQRERTLFTTMTDQTAKAPARPHSRAWPDDAGPGGNPIPERRCRPRPGEQHGVCIRPVAMRRIDITTDCVDIVLSRAGPPGKISAHLVRRRAAGCGLRNVVKVGISRPNRSPSGPNPPRSTRHWRWITLRNLKNWFPTASRTMVRRCPLRPR